MFRYLTHKTMQLTDALNARGPADQLSIADYVLELLSESGEFGDAVKKFRRMTLGFKRKRNPLSEADAKKKIRKEAGDVLMCLLRCCKLLDIDPVECFIEKYNVLVEEEGLDFPISGKDWSEFCGGMVKLDFSVIEREFGPVITKPIPIVNRDMM